jgi:regulator of extracellular matrix RemA (YlzA/DUF370 family)
LNVGFNNSVAEERIIAIVSAEASPIRRLKEEALRAGRLVDGTNGRKTRSVIVTDSNHVVLSSLEPETLSGRLRNEEAAGDLETDR